ncbi:twin-arginine translocation signal domain-containing protein [Burkholderia guangdongensis]|uniref:twin-arginine translocation signal domain-containing protein n=1 Tax=Burkholderia guangdongensis TaxID=1792500 RepID=UPI0015CB9B83|nr:twin-arginine translocation signal domain-containing protein [Burkholderia guangdongensis]
MRTLDKRPTISRRNFLKTTGITTVGITTVSAASLLMSSANAWANSVAATGGPDADVAKTLLKVARDIYPHDQFSDAIYMKALDPYGQAAATDPALKALLSDGVKNLDGLAKARFGKPYAQVDAEADRVTLLKSIDTTPFFAKLRGDLVVNLYDNHDVWKKLGYEGSSWEKGGYLNRGFNDLDWL